jgi:alginate O-acetyltransferase complex protein AlgI
MVFNSLQFAALFVPVYLAYLFSNHRAQNLILLIASYIFYGAWDYRFVSILLISSLIDYYCGIKIFEAPNQKQKKIYLTISIISNLGILGFFKYFNFFAENLAELLNLFGFSTHLGTLQILLPIGISFYTFQALSYSIDVYRGELKPTKDLAAFLLFVSFFPQLVAGPIERAKNLLPQILSPRKVNLNQFYQGSYLIFWGLFEKMFVADNLGVLVGRVFNGEGAVTGNYNGVTVALASYGFILQLLFDFDGYSNIARGLANLMGFELMVNFNCPYFVTNPIDFWRRWHISLTTWFRDYLYFTLGGNRRGQLRTVINLFAVMGLMGLWHGASWTFVNFGFYNALVIVVYLLISKTVSKIQFDSAFLKAVWYIVRVIFWFQVCAVGGLLFRATDMNQVWQMFTSLPDLNFDTKEVITIAPRLIFFTAIPFIVQIFQFRKDDLLIVLKWPFLCRTIFYAICLHLLLVFGVNGAKTYIYFQF